MHPSFRSADGHGVIYFFRGYWSDVTPALAAAEGPSTLCVSARRDPYSVRDPTGHSYHVGPIPVAAEASLSSDAFLWGLDLFNHGYYWEAHEAWEGLWQVADRDGPLRVLFKGLILLSAAGVKIRERKNAAAARHAKRAAALFRQLPDRTFERALGMSHSALADCAEAAMRIFPLTYRRQRLDSLNPSSISFSEQIPAGRRADRKRETVTCRRRYEILPAG